MRLVHEEEGGLIRTSGVPAASDRRAIKMSLTSSCRAHIKAKGLNRGIGALMFSVVVTSLRGSVGCVSRWWSPFGRPGSQPQVIDGRSKASLTSSPQAPWVPL